MVDFAPDSVAYAVTMIGVSIVIWVGMDLFLFDQFSWTNVLSGAACGLAIVVTHRWMHDAND